MARGHERESDHFGRLGAHTASVRARTALPADLVALAQRQAGVLSRDQLLRFALSRQTIARLLASGLLTVVTPGIYLRGGEPSWMSRAWAGLLIGGSTAVLGGPTAGYLQKLVREPPDVITVYSNRQLAPRDGWLFVRGTRACSGEPARTRYEATVIDLCAERDEDDVAAVLADAVSSRRTTTKKLLAEVHSRSRLRHRSLLCDVLDDVDAGAHSALERRFLVDVERAHGLPTATRQAHAGTAHRSDAWYEEYALVVELDSKRHHSGGATFHDTTRDNDHALVGLTTLRLRWAHVTGSNACATAQVLGAALAARGWYGPLTSCPKCALVHPI